MSPISWFILKGLFLWQASLGLCNDSHRNGRALWRRDGCGSNPTWATTVEAWEAADTDRNLRQWWDSIRRNKSGASITNELARQFGNGYTGYSCSITDEGSCIIPGCQDYIDKGSPVWAYLALNAVVNMNTFLNRLWQGIGLGQDDFGNKASAIAQTFFPWKDPTVGTSEAVFWVDVTFGALFGFIAPESRLAIAGRDAIMAFAHAGAQQAQLSLRTDPGLTLEQGTAEISDAAAQSAQASRKKLEEWAVTLFSGQSDATGKTMLDYLKGGSFIVPTNITNNLIELFWERSLIARTINSQWITQPYFITFARTADRKTAVGPVNTKYYSQAAGGVYYLYSWRNGGLEMPDGLEELEAYGIGPGTVTEASARAFMANKFNYNNTVALQQLHASLFNATSNPVLDGAAWTGNFNLSVCDMGTHLDWNGRYGVDSVAPCCCGENCEDTKTFVELANLRGVQSYIKQCKKQLDGTELNFDDIDYGFEIQKFTTGQIAGIVVGAALGAFILVGFCCCICC